MSAKRLYWLASYPKSGNTWFRVFLTNLLTNQSVPASINALKTDGIASSRAWLDNVLGFDTADLNRTEITRLRPTVYAWTAQRADNPSYHKIHDALVRTETGPWLVPPQETAGALYFIRNPLDVALSYANHKSCTPDEAIALMGDSDHCMATQTDQSLKNQVEQRLLTWSGHVESWTGDTGIDTHVTRYEDMLAAPYDAFMEAAGFLQLPTDPDRIKTAIGQSEFSELQRQEKAETFREGPPEVKRFFRKGIAGEWQTRLTADQISRIIEDHGAVMRRFGYLEVDGTPKVM